jgi:hypothetical protein
MSLFSLSFFSSLVVYFPLLFSVLLGLPIFPFSSSSYFWFWSLVSSSVCDKCQPSRRMWLHFSRMFCCHKSNSGKETNHRPASLIATFWLAMLGLPTLLLLVPTCSLLALALGLTSWS